MQSCLSHPIHCICQVILCHLTSSLSAVKVLCTHTHTHCYIPLNTQGQIELEKSLCSATHIRTHTLGVLFAGDDSGIIVDKQRVFDGACWPSAIQSSHCPACVCVIVCVCFRYGKQKGNGKTQRETTQELLVFGLDLMRFWRNVRTNVSSTSTCEG